MNAFGHYYKLWIRRNVQLFSDDLHYTEHITNEINKEVEFKHSSFDLHKCVKDKNPALLVQFWESSSMEK